MKTERPPIQEYKVERGKDQEQWNQSSPFMKRANGMWKAAAEKENAAKQVFVAMGTNGKEQEFTATPLYKGRGGELSFSPRKRTRIVELFNRTAKSLQQFGGMDKEDARTNASFALMVMPQMQLEKATRRITALQKEQTQNVARLQELQKQKTELQQKMLTENLSELDNEIVRVGNEANKLHVEMLQLTMLDEKIKSSGGSIGSDINNLMNSMTLTVTNTKAQTPLEMIEEQKNEKQNRFDGLVKRLEDLVNKRKLIASLADERARLQSETENISGLEAEFNETSTKLGEVQQKVKDKKEELTQLTKDLGAVKDVIADLAKRIKADKATLAENQKKEKDSGIAIVSPISADSIKKLEEERTKAIKARQDLSIKGAHINKELKDTEMEVGGLQTRLDELEISGANTGLIVNLRKSIVNIADKIRELEDKDDIKAIRAWKVDAEKLDTEEKTLAQRIKDATAKLKSLTLNAALLQRMETEGMQLANNADLGLLNTQEVIHAPRPHGLLQKIINFISEDAWARHWGTVRAPVVRAMPANPELEEILPKSRLVVTEQWVGEVKEKLNAEPDLLDELETLSGTSSGAILWGAFDDRAAFQKALNKKKMTLDQALAVFKYMSHQYVTNNPGNEMPTKEEILAAKALEDAQHLSHMLTRATAMSDVFKGEEGWKAAGLSEIQINALKEYTPASRETVAAELKDDKLWADMWQKLLQYAKSNNLKIEIPPMAAETGEGAMLRKEVVPEEEEAAEQVQPTSEEESPLEVEGDPMEGLLRNQIEMVQ
ncbi:MAG: hypothetical protein M1504_00210 [Candidatus Marsarchaeota archaeon]|nr:hypothetical protein [Candidatus Marsarchaeota archaeon]